MKWFIGIINGKVEFEGGCAHGTKVVTASFGPTEVMQARAFVSEWMVTDKGNQVMFRSSWNHPTSEGMELGFDPHEWMQSVCARA